MTPQTFEFDAISIKAACTPTGFYRDGMNLTAAQIGGDVTGTLNATGCDIGVYYGPGATGSVTGATIANAKYFGIVNDGQNVNVTNSTISNIGNALRRHATRCRNPLHDRALRRSA